MKLKKAECAHCGSSAKVKLYWSTRNLLKTPLKTHYCLKCASLIVPKQDFISEQSHSSPRLTYGLSND